MSGAMLLLVFAAAITGAGVIGALVGFWWAIATYCAISVILMVLVLRP